MSKKKLISMLLAAMMLFLSALPVSSVFADEAKKYHPDDWFGYHHSEAEIDSWIKNAVKYPNISEEAVKALTGEIRPGDAISFQVELDMPNGHEEIMPFLKDFTLNMVFPYGTIAMIEVYNENAPLLTDEKYQEKISEFDGYIDEIEEMLNDEQLLEDIEAGLVPKSEYIMLSDLVENRDKYYNIYLNQLETARTKYGFIGGSYGTANSWMGAFEDDPNLNLEEGTTYESYRKEIIEESWVAPKITAEEFEQTLSEFNAQYPTMVDEFMSDYAEAKEQYNHGELSEEDWLMYTTTAESIQDGIFYDTVIKYFEDCRDGYYKYENDYSVRFLGLALGGIDCLNAYSGQYSFEFPDNIVQSNQACTYIFDVNIVATDALSVGGYLSLPSLKWYYEESCPSTYWVSDGFLKGHFENYHKCNSRRSSFINFGNRYYANNLFISDANMSELDKEMCRDKRFPALNYISTEYNDTDYFQKLFLEYGEKLMKNNILRAIRPITVECRDEYGSVIKTNTVEVYDACYDIAPEEIYDYQLVSSENLKGVIENENTTVTFYYEHKDAEINVSFVDVDGNEIAPMETIKGKTLDEYHANPVEVFGYNLIETPANASGVLHEDSDHVQFIYKIKPATVSVNYLDTDGKPIAKGETIYGQMFDAYNAVPKEIEGYELVAIPENATGEMTEDNTIVNYIYKLKNS